jgi:hypothetical protein
MSEQRDIKEFYRTWQGCLVDQIWPVNEKLAEIILSYRPKSAFEFGCALAKHAKLLPGVDYFGIDVNPDGPRMARKAGIDAMQGDETILERIPEYDVVFTCSVLNHIPDITGIIPELKRIASKAVVICETNDIPEDEKDAWRYYSHNYEQYGFKKLDYEWQSFHRLQKYHIYVIEK